MRIRSIKPEFWTDKTVGSWDHFTRLLFIGLWSAADDFGRGSAEPVRLAAALFPYDISQNFLDVHQKILASLQKLSAAKKIRFYEADGEKFYEVVNWGRHQYIQRPAKSCIPEPSNGVPCDLPENSGELPENSCRNREQGTGNREQGEGSGRILAPANQTQETLAEATEIPTVDQVKARVMTSGIPDDFVEFVYNSWITRSGKDGAGVHVEITNYVRGRWKKEQVEWRNGTHHQKGNQANGTGRQSSKQGLNRNTGTLNDPSRYSEENLRKLSNFHGPNEV